LRRGRFVVLIRAVAQPEPTPTTPKRVARKPRDFLDACEGQLSPWERFNVRLARATLEPGGVDRTMRFLQRNVGARWINGAIPRLRHVHGIERLPELLPGKSYLCVSNHRSFFDMYVVSAHLVARGMPHRLVFPVKSTFFYDRPLGPFVNGTMSFFAMYPPIFRDRERAALNVASLDEIVRLLGQGGTFVGIHPEGTRKQDGDPYTFLPAQSGVGRVIHKARVPVLPVFVNGLVNSIPSQVRGNVTGRGTPVFVVFGAPIDFGATLDSAASPRTYKRLSEMTIDAIAALGHEERRLRAALTTEAAP
jgi:1-acyl-sn-glycerol-3-phosphate acyltransferase